MISLHDPFQGPTCSRVGLRRQLELDDLAGLVAEIEETSGPFDPEVVARHAQEMR